MQTFDTPVDRLREVTFGQLGDRSWPNILLGIFIGAVIQTVAPSQLWWAIGSGVAWGGAVVVYSVVDEVQAAIEERKNRLLEPIDARPRGVE